ncbi:MAG: type II toxin-antitoxin system RelE/ParE family toxin [Bacteroidota bacterium]
MVVKIDELANNPLPTGCEKLKGAKENLWRIRIGDYRVIYSIENFLQIISIKKIGHRKDIYLK